jgi:hypothetical protein
MADFPILFFIMTPQGSVKVSVMVMLLMNGCLKLVFLKVLILGEVVGISKQVNKKNKMIPLSQQL